MARLLHYWRKTRCERGHKRDGEEIILIISHNSSFNHHSHNYPNIFFKPVCDPNQEHLTAYEVIDI